jgi:hypothetical protein
LPPIIAAFKVVPDEADELALDAAGVDELPAAGVLDDELLDEPQAAVASAMAAIPAAPHIFRIRKSPLHVQIDLHC